MEITPQEALDCFASDDLIGIGMEADAVRRALHPENVVTYATTTAIALGRPQSTPTASFVFGLGETSEDLVHRLFAIRKVQAEINGFTAFTLLGPTPAASREPPTAVEYLRTLAIARIVLDNVPNIESDCLAQGLKVVQMALRFGANDAGYLTAPDAPANTDFTEEDLRRVIRDAGFTPVERDPHYRTYYLNN